MFPSNAYVALADVLDALRTVCIEMTQFAVEHPWAILMRAHDDGHAHIATAPPRINPARASDQNVANPSHA